MTTIIFSSAAKPLFSVVLMLLLFNMALKGQVQVPNSTQDRELRLNEFTITVEQNTNRAGKDYHNFELRENEPCKMCEEACLNDPKCKAFTYVKPGVQGVNARCWLKSEVPAATRNADCISGVKVPVVPVLGTSTIFPPSNLPAGWGEDEPRIKSNTNLPGKDYRNFKVEGEDPVPQVCFIACQGDPECAAWTYVQPGIQGTSAVCWLKKEVPANALKDDNCISGIKVLPVINATAANFKSTAISPERRTQLLKEFNNQWQSIVKTNMGEINLKLQLAAEEMKDRQIKITNHYALQYQIVSALPQPIPNPGAPLSVFGKNSYYDPYQLVVKPGEKTTAQGIHTVDPGKIMKPPIVEMVKALTTNPKLQGGLQPNQVWEGEYVIIYGQNLGDCLDDNCGVKVERIGNMEFVKEADQKRETFDLIAFQMDWSRSWHNDFIVARIPVFKDVVHYGWKSNLIIWKGGEKAFSRKYEVIIQPIGPSLSYVHEVPMYREGHLSPGGNALIYGSGFGAYQPKKENTKNYSKVELRLKERETPTIIELKVLEWGGGFIKVLVPNDLKPGVRVEDGELIVTSIHDGTEKTAMQQQKFGPRMVVTSVSGLQYLELVKGENEDHAIEQYDAAQEGNIMVVKHFPGCGWSGEDGEDKIFRRGTAYDYGDVKPTVWALPENVTMENYLFYAVNPEDMVDNFEFAMKELIKLISDPRVFLGEWMAYGIISAFCPGFGDHKTELWKAPSSNSPMMEIHWENTCWMRYSGLPNIYTTSFILRGPEGMVPGEPKKNSN